MKNTRFAVAENTNIRLIALMTLLLLFIYAATVNAEWVDTIIDVGLVTTYDDNLNRAFFSSLEKEDTLFIPTVSVGRMYQLAEFTRARITADAKGQIHADFDRLNNLFGGATLAVSHKLGIGPYKPWFRVHGSAGYLEVPDDDLRDGWLVNSGITVGKRLTDRFDVLVSYLFDFRDSQDGPRSDPEISGAAFDLEGHTGSVLGNFLLTNNLLFSASYSFRHGDISSTCDRATVVMIDEKTAFTRDTAFDEPLCAYRISGDLHEISFGTTYALSSHAALSVGYHRTEAEAESLEYSNNRINISVNYSFQ